MSQLLSFLARSVMSRGVGRVLRSLPSWFVIGLAVLAAAGYALSR